MLGVADESYGMQCLLLSQRHSSSFQHKGYIQIEYLKAPRAINLC